MSLAGLEKTNDEVGLPISPVCGSPRAVCLATVENRWSNPAGLFLRRFVQTSVSKDFYCSKLNLEHMLNSDGHDLKVINSNS